MNNKVNSRLLSFLLAMVMIFGTISPAFAAGLEAPIDSVQNVESELISENGKLRARLVAPENAQVQTRSEGLFRAPAKAPGFDNTTVKVEIKKHGIGSNEFNFDAIFGAGASKTITLYNDADDSEQKVRFNSTDTSVQFPTAIPMEDIVNGDACIEFEGGNVAGKLTYEESADYHSGAGNVTTFTLDLYQVRNTDVVVTTKTADGTAAANPTTTATGGKIKLTAGQTTETIDIPIGNDATETVTRINTRNKDDINKGVAFTIEGTKNGVLIDKTANKVYKPEVKVDPDGLKPTEITFTEKNVAETVKENGGLDPVTIKVWKSDDIAWDKGVAPKTTNTDARELVQQLLDNAEVTDLSGRSSDAQGKFEGKLQVKFCDGSTLEVEKQMLIVSEHIVTLNPNDPDAPKEEDLPDDKIEVRFLKSTGVESITTTGKTYVKPETVFQDKDFPQDITFIDGYKGPATWSPADKKVTRSSPAFLKRQGYFRFTAKATKLDDIIGPVNPDDTPNPDAKNYWKVTFKSADKKTGTVDANNTYYVLKIANKTLADLTAPNTTPAEGYTFNKWTPAVDDKTKVDKDIEVIGTFVKDIIPVPDPENPPVKPDGFVDVVFDKGAHGEFADGAVTKYFVNPNAGKTLADITKPGIDAAEGWKHTGWDKEDTEPIGKAGLTVTAQYKENTPTTEDKDNYDPHYVGKSGKPGETVQIVPPTFTDGTGKTVDKPVDNTTTPAKETTFAAGNGTLSGVTVDPNTGAISVVIPQDAKPGDKITVPVDVTYPDGSNETVEVNVTVIDPGKEQSKTPTIDEPTEGDDKITGKGEPGAKIEVKDKDGNKIGETTVKPDKTWEVDVPQDKPLKKGDVITATQTETGNEPSKPATATVKGKTTPPYFNYLTLTLDENYRGGEITHHDVYEGDLIERYLYTPRRRGYVFEGWSYRSDYLDEVRPGDRINYSITIYAIWSKDRDYDRDEREEEPEDTREVLEHKAYMFGYTDGTVRPNGNITRAEAAALVTRLLGIESIGAATRPMFTDTPSAWYNKAINAAVQRGIMKGYPDGRFRPNAPITRAEFTQMIAQIDNKPYGIAPFADVKGHWAELAIGREYQAKRIMGYPDGTFRPNAHITRCEAVVILNKMFERNYDDMSAINAMNRHLIKSFLDLSQSFWGYNDMVEATNSHDFKRRVKGLIQEDWVEVK